MHSQEEGEESGSMSLLQNPDAVAAVDELLQNVDGIKSLFCSCLDFFLERGR